MSDGQPMPLPNQKMFFLTPSTATIDPQLNPREGNPDCGPHSHPPARACRDTLFTQVSTVSSCAFREQRDALAARPSLTGTPTKSFQSPSPFPNSWRGGGMGGSASTARIDRAHSDRARSASKEAGRPSRRHCHPNKSFQFPSSPFFQLVAGWQGGVALNCARRTRAF
jgi:hypothetical protein